MPSNRFDEVRDYGFADRALALRQRAGLTQEELAALVGVGVRSVQAWEAALSYPGAERLQQLIALYLARGGFPAGREEEEATALWEAARAHAPRRIVPFDRGWFAALGSVTNARPSLALPAAGAAPYQSNWGDVPDAARFYGRAEELELLARWLLVDRCRLVAVLGAGGIGKTLLAARLAREAAPQFAVVYWRSLRNAPPPEEWLAGAIVAFSAQQALPPNGCAARLDMLLRLLQAQRGLLVLDNLESILEPGAPEPRYRAGYAGYGEVLQCVAESVHQSCVLLTGREAPPELVLLARERGPVRTLRLGGLGREAARALLQDRGLAGDAAAWEALIAHYRGNPLALNMVVETIDAVFGGEIAAFLAQDVAVFGGIRQLLDEQVTRLSPLERTIVTWLAVEREPVGFSDLTADLGQGTMRGSVVEAVEALQRRSLLERGNGGAITLHPVVLEYTTTRLVTALVEEILTGEPALLVRFALLKAQAKDYVRHSQERLIAHPVLASLRESLGGTRAAERRLVALLQEWRGRPADEQGYGPGNVVNLLRLLRGDLRGLDLSRLSIRQAYLQEVAMQGANLAGSHVAETMWGEAFGAVFSVAVSADGAYVAAGTLGGEVRMWRVADRTPIMSAQGHTGGVVAVAFSAGGQLLASGSMDTTVRLWHSESGRPLTTITGPAGGVWGVALSTEGRLLASGSHDGTVKLWEPESGRLLATLQGHTGAVTDVAFSADGRLLASGSQDGTVMLWEASSWRPLATLQGHVGGVRGVALSGDGQLLASGSQDGTVKLWEPASGRLLATLQDHASGIWGVAFSADGRLLASGSQDGTVMLWEASSWRPLATLQGHTEGVTGVAFSADGRLLASGSQDGTVKLWEPARGRLLATLQGHASGIWDVALSDDGRLLASGSMDRTVRLWEVASGHLLATLAGHTGAVVDVALSGNGEVLASGSWDGTIKLWEAGTGRLRATLQGHSGVFGVALLTERRLLASGGLDGIVRLWDAEIGRLLMTLDGHIGQVNRVALSGDGRLLASAGLDRTVRLWDVESGRSLVTLQGHTDGVWGLALSADGRLVASGSIDRTINLWDVPSGRLVTTLEGHLAGVWSVALSADGRLLASGSFDGTVRLWQLPSGRPLATLEGHAGVVYSVTLSSDGRLAASAGIDGAVRLWDTHNAVVLRTLQSDRHYERMDITGLIGVTDVQRGALIALGAVERTMAQASPFAQTGTPHLVQAAPSSESALGSAPPQMLEPASAAGLARSPSNLPPARTSFVGRAADLAALTQELSSAPGDGTRLLTLSGVAGSGKTRLALQVAEAIRDAYRDGVRLVELAPLPASRAPDPTGVAAATLSALGLQEQPGTAPLDTLLAHLQSRRLLLVLDNCEHLVAACAELAARLLAACPELQILATSQRALGSAGEVAWQVAPLALPAPLEGAPIEADLALQEQSDAVRLFVVRAQVIRPGFALSAANAAVVGAICRCLDGLPLAIELAAARLDVLPLEEILARLDDRFRLLRRGGRTTDERHQTLQATLDWSYDLLDPAERALLRRLAVFAGGWELAAAEAVCAGGEVAEEAVLDLLDELLDRSLVYVYEAGGEPRYGLLETVRAYGWQQLERAGEMAILRDRRLAWCVALVEQAGPALLGPAQATWLERLEREHDNLRAALQWALDGGHDALGLRLGAGLWMFWLRRRSQREGRQWLATFLARAPDHDDATSMSLRASALDGAAWLAADGHDFAQADALFAQSDALRLAMGQDERTNGLLINAAMEARAKGDYARATILLEESLARHRAQGNRAGILVGGLGLSLSRLALVLAEQGEYARATALYEECLALVRGLGDREGVGITLLGLGDIARDQGDAARTRAYCEECLSLFRDLGYQWAIGFSLNNLALAAYLDGDLALGARRAEESVALFRGLDAEPSLAEVLVTLGRVRGAQGEVAAAWAHLIEALTLASAKGPRVVVAAALEALGMVAVRQGPREDGVQFLGAAAALREAMGVPIRPADRPAVADAVAAARAALGRLPFEVAWGSGQSLSMEQVNARARAGSEGGPAGA